jgi:uronate dehydrogenase
VKVALTGSNGLVGSVLRTRLKGELELTLLDLPEADVRDYETVLAHLGGTSTVVHLAWNTRDDHYRGGPGDRGNVRMAENVYRAAAQMGVPRVVVASSVHVDNFYACPGGKLLSVSSRPAPTTGYGARKVAVEELGREYAERDGLEVVCLRLGAVLARDRRPKGEWPARLWLRHGDLAALVRCCLVAPRFEPGFQVVNAVSDNAGRVHDLSNALGWKPGAT